MKRIIIFSALCTLLCFTFGFTTVNAEESKVDMNKCITLTVKQGAEIQLGFAASTSGVWVKVTGVKNEKVEKAPITLPSWNNQNKYEATGTEITVYGAIEEFICSNNHENLTALDVRQNVNLTRLYCWRNQLSSLDVSHNVNLMKLECEHNQLSSLDVSQNTQLEKISIYGNNFSTSTLNNLYCQLPDRSGEEEGVIYPVYEKGDTLDELLAKSSSQTITNAKNWAIKYEYLKYYIFGITGNYTCGSSYGLTLAPATIPNSFTYKGGEWKTTVTSAGNWKIDESTLSSWLSVNPKQGNSGTQVTVTANLNTGSGSRRGAITFVLRNDPTTKQVVLVAQFPQRPLFVTPAEGYTFPASGETKENYFTVESTGAWKVTSSNMDWFPVETKEGAAGTTQVTIKAEANNSKEERTTELTFALKDNAEIKQVVTLKQSGASISVTPSQEYTFPYAGETKTFTVESSMVWTVTASNAEWLTIEPKSGAAGTATVTVKADANSNKEERSTELTFALKDNADVKQVVKVKQAVNPSAVEDVLFAGISVAPNPFSSQLKIKNEEAVNARYELVNTKGVMVCSGVLQGVETELNTEKIPAGAYLLRILAGSESKTLRVVKE